MAPPTNTVSPSSPSNAVDLSTDRAPSPPDAPGIVLHGLDAQGQQIQIPGEVGITGREASQRLTQQYPGAQFLGFSYALPTPDLQPASTPVGSGRQMLATRQFPGRPGMTFSSQIPSLIAGTAGPAVLGPMVAGGVGALTGPAAPVAIPAAMIALAALSAGAASPLGALYQRHAQPQSPDVSLLDRTKLSAKSGAEGEAFSQLLGALQLGYRAMRARQAGKVISTAAAVPSAANQAGQEVSNVASDINARLGGEAATAANVADRAQANYAPEVSRKIRDIAKAPSPTLDVATNRLIPPRAPGAPPAGGQFMPTPKLATGDISPLVASTRAAASAAGQRSMDFARVLGFAGEGAKPILDRMLPQRATLTLVNNPDVANVLLAHATSAESKVIREAISTGAALGVLPATVGITKAMAEHALSGAAPAAPGILPTIQDILIAGGLTAVGHATYGVAYASRGVLQRVLQHTLATPDLAQALAITMKQATGTPAWQTAARSFVSQLTSSQLTTPRPLPASRRTRPTPTPTPTPQP